MHAKLYQYHLHGGQISNVNSNKIKVPLKCKRKKEKESKKIQKVGHPKGGYISLVFRPSRWLTPPCIICKVLPSNGPNCLPSFLVELPWDSEQDETLWAAALFSSILQKNTDLKYLLSQWAWVSILHTDTSSAVQKRWESVFCNNFRLMFFHSHIISYLSESFKSLSSDIIFSDLLG